MEAQATNLKGLKDAAGAKWKELNLEVKTRNLLRGDTTHYEKVEKTAQETADAFRRYADALKSGAPNRKRAYKRAVFNEARAYFTIGMIKAMSGDFNAFEKLIDKTSVLLAEAGKTFRAKILAQQAEKLRGLNATLRKEEK